MSTESIQPRYVYEKPWMRLLINAPGVLLSIGLLGIVLVSGSFMTDSDLLFSSRNMANILQFQGLAHLILIPAAVLVVIAGGVDLSLGMTVGLVLVLVATLEPSLGTIGAAAIAMFAALLVGTVNGLLAGSTRIPGLLVTAATATLLAGILYTFTSPQGQPISESSFLTSPVLPWACLGIAVLLGVPLGIVTLYRPAVRQKDGYESWARRLFFVGSPYVLSAFSAGLVGLVYAGRLRISLASVGSGLEIEMALIALLGGAVLGMPHLSSNLINMLGAVFATLALVLLKNVLTLSQFQEGNNIQLQLFTGGGLLFAVLTSYIYYSLMSRIRAQPKPEPTLEPPSIEVSPVV